MDSGGFILGQGSLRRALAILGCLVILYFASGGIFLHEHTSGPETVCPVCHALHAPALAVAPVHLIVVAQQIAWQASPPEPTPPTESVSLYRASRAPPQA